MKLSNHAKELHEQAIIIDGHCDILVPVTDRKVRLGEWTQIPDPTTWEPPMGFEMDPSSNIYDFSPHTQYFGPAGQYSIPQFIQGGLTAQACAIYLEDTHLDRALQRALEMTWWLYKEAEDNPNFELITRVADIHKIKREGKCGGFLTFEGLEPLGFDLRFLDLFYKFGLRMASLSHARRNFFADGQRANVKTGGLTELGKQAVKRMNELGIVVDLGHINLTGFWEVIELCKAPLVFSHTSPRKYFPARSEDSSLYPTFIMEQGHERLRAIADTGGVVGVIFYNQEDLDEVIKDIEYVIDIVGPDHVGLGSDLYGFERAPKNLEDMSKLPAITQRLLERGHSDENILKILGENYLRVFSKVWKE